MRGQAQAADAVEREMKWYVYRVKGRLDAGEYEARGVHAPVFGTRVTILSFKKEV